MMNPQVFFKAISTAFMLLFTSPSFAGGPLVLEGPTGNTPVRYQNPNITIHVENGRLGKYSNAAANTLVQDAFNLWNQVNSASVNLTINTTSINLDINASNVESYLPSVDNTVFNAEDNLNPLVYDNNGEIIDAYFGDGQSDYTAGFAASIWTLDSSYFDEGYAVINGKDIGLSLGTFKLLISHEIGHFIGLDHSQGNISNQESDFGFPRICSTSNASNYPVMYPFVCRENTSLHADDISAVSALYPSPTLSSDFGTLQGVFVSDNSSPVLGTNIWVQNTFSGENVSVVSDYLKQGTGFYKLFLPAGNYTLHANSINQQFNGASGIGPYALSVLDRSFTAPHPITDVTYQGDNPGNDEVITITAGQTQTINFSSSGTAVIIPGDSNNTPAADVFGATSPITLLLLLMLPGLIRHFDQHSTPVKLR